MLVQEFLNRYNETTAKVMSQVLREAETLMEKPVDDFTQDDAISYSTAISNVGNGTQKRKLSTLSAYCKYLMARDKIAKNPFDIVKRPKNDPVRSIKWLREDDRNRLLDNTEGIDRALIACGLAGLRLAEIVSLNVDQLYDGRLWNVEGKGEKIRTVPLTNEIDRILTEYVDYRLSGPMFKIKGNRINRRTVQKYVNRASKEVLGESIHVHALRHTFATLGAKADIPVMKLGRMLGHSNPAVTQVYVHLDDEDLRDAVRVMDRKPNLRVLEQSA